MAVTAWDSELGSTSLSCPSISWPPGSTSSLTAPPEDPDCGLYGLTLDANFRLLFPLVRPYISAGLAYRNISPVEIGGDETVAGLGLGLGVDVALAGVRLFGESRYEFLDAPEKQFLWRLGALFEVF